ncbi:hypothetical protein PR048_031994 [Dryococelus australis]|uniref:Uncharacterized protein n=1 Tax=Dryococelus australis TaxID=614101 RepID=A0ABQ9G6V9_9NEOP|nr:hypothetical protein PR048_031994 [Dryococelus australis]
MSKGLFCKHCALFTQEKVGHNQGVKVNRLVTEALTEYNDLTEKDGWLEMHESSNYLHICVASVEANRARLHPITEAWGIRIYLLEVTETMGNFVRNR